MHCSPCSLSSHYPDPRTSWAIQGLPSKHASRGFGAEIRVQASGTNWFMQVCCPAVPLGHRQTWDQKYLLATTNFDGVRWTNSVLLKKVFYFADPYKMFHILDLPGGSCIPPARNWCEEFSCQCCVCFARGAQTGCLRRWTRGWVSAPPRVSQESANEGRRQQEGDSQQEPDLLHIRKIVQCLAGLTLQPSGFRNSNKAAERWADVSWRGTTKADGCVISYILPFTSAGFSI